MIFRPVRQLTSAITDGHRAFCFPIQCTPYLHRCGHRIEHGMFFLPENVKGIIADCGFTSPKAIISQVFRTVTHLPAAPSVWIADKFAQLFAGFSLAGEDSRKSLAASRVPILIVHGKDDHFVPCRMSEQGYAACAGPKHLLLVDGAGHGVSFIVDTERYTALIIDFLKTNLEGFC